jgi:hypothetical protein
MQPITLCNSASATHYSGDSWNGLTIKKSFIGDPLDAPPGVKNARLQFRDYDDTLIYELSTFTGSENGLPKGYPFNLKGNISIVEHPSYIWVLSLDAQPLPMPVGTYAWDLEIVDTLNIKHTILTGTLSICKDITR